MLNRLYSFFFNRANQVRESFVKKEQESPWRTTIFSVFYLFFLEIATSFLKFLILIFKTPYESFQLFTNQYTLPVCQYSYFDHKKFQKKIRLFSLAGLSTVLSATIIINLVLSLILPGQIPSYAKTVYPTGDLWDNWSLSSTIQGDPTAGTSPAGSLKVDGSTISSSTNTIVSGTGVNSTLGLKSTTYTASDDGTFSSTGSASGGMFNSYGITKSSTGVLGFGSSASVILGNAQQISTGATHSCAIMSDGTAYCWGDNTNGQLGDGTVVQRSTPVQVHGVNDSGYLTNVAQISAGYYATCAVKNDGTAYCWGNNNNGQLGDNTTTQSLTPVQVKGVGGTGNLTGVMRINAGYADACVVKNDGTAYCWGYNVNGQLGDNTTTQRLTPVPVKGVGGTGTLANVAQISAGANDTCAVTTSGAAYCWGNNGNGQLGDNTVTQRNAPIQVLGVGGTGTLSNVLQISIEQYHTCAVTTSGAAYCWGDNTNGQLGDNTTTQRTTPVQVKGVGGIGTLANVVQISAGGGFWGKFSCAVKTDGTVYCWGNDSYGQLGDNTTGDKAVPVQVKGVGGTGTLANVAQISAQYSSSSYQFTCAVKNDGTAYCWGYNTYGQLGDNTTTTRYAPVQVLGTGTISNLTGVTQISSGTNYACAVLNGGASGTVYCWGDNANGQLGDGTTSQRMLPVQVKGVGGTGYLTGVSQVAVSTGDSRYLSTCALKADGTVYCWGYGSDGELGNNSTGSSTTPVQVKGVGGTGTLTGVSQIAMGQWPNNACAVVNAGASGTAYCWGGNTYGQLGDNTTTQRNAPVQVLGVGGTGYLTGVTQITTDYYATCAALSGGTAYCWGYNTYGQLGDNTTTQRLTPVQVKGVGGTGFLTGVSQIDVGINYTCAVVNAGASGTAYCWGYGSAGQVGDGAASSSATPLQVVGVGGVGNLSGVVQISSGTNNTCASLSNGAAYCWGGNNYGQLGDNTTTQRLSPVQVKGVGGTGFLTGVTQMSTGGYGANISCAVVNPGASGTAYCWGINTKGQLGDNTTIQRNAPVNVLSFTPSSSGISLIPSYPSSGNFESAVIDLSLPSSFVSMSWNSNQPTGADLDLQIATSNNSSGPWTYYNYDGTTGGVPADSTKAFSKDNTYCTVTGTNPYTVTCTISNSTLQSAINGNRYMKYKAYLTGTGSNTPSLNNITISYSQYPTSSVVTNLKFNTTYTSVKWTQISLATASSMTASVKVKARVRVANIDPETVTPTPPSFVGNDGTNTNSSTYFDLFGSGQTNCSESPGKFGDTVAPNDTKKTVTCLINQNDSVINVSANQWLDLELTFVSDGGTTSQLDAVRATYSINSNPEVCATLLASDATNQTCDPSVTTMPVAQSTSNVGHVTINGNNVVYIRDTDTSTGTTAPGQVLVGLEYSDSAGSFSQATPPSSGTSYYNTGNFASNFTLTPVSSSLTCTATGFTSAWKYLCRVNNNGTGGNSVDPRVFAGYTIDWNAKADFANMSSDAFKVRLLVNDQEGINPVNISSPATSAAFAIDTVNPTGTVIVDATAKATSNNSNAVVSCSDGSTAPSAPHYPCSYSMSTDDTTFDPWQSFTGASTTIRQTLAENATRESVLYFKLKDSYGNELPYDTGITGKKVITGQRPQNVAIQDVSNVRATPKSYKEFLSWEVVGTPTNGFASYDIYRCDSSVVGDSTCTNPLSYAKIASATPTGDRSVNYYTDSSLDPTLTYYYRIATKDLLGNISAWSTALSGIPDGTQNAGEGGGGGDVTPATISNIQIPSASITQNSAVITWTTSETANGGVFYGTSYGTEQSSLGYGTSHSISLSGLTPGVTYNIQLKSTDASGNQTICDGTSATSSSTNATNNTVTATNSATYCPSGATYSFTTASVDTTPPVISAISSVVTSTWATITWTTNEAADTCIGSRDAATSSYTTEQCKSESVTSHSLTLSSLNPSTTYYIKVKSRDANSNLAQNCYANSDNASVTVSDCPGTSLGTLSFTTSAPVPTSTGGGGGGGGGKTDLDAPRISDIKVSDVGAVSATITWKTNEDSSSLVQSGTDKDKLKDTSGQIDSVSDHKVVLKNLTPSTKYFFRVVSIDAAGNIGSPDPESFTTKQEISAEELKGTAEEKKNTQQVLEDLKKQIQLQGDSINDPLQTLLESVSSLVPEPIIIGESPIVDETSTSAKISWRTDKNSNSFVALSRDDQYDSKADEPYRSVVGNPEDSVKDHMVNVENLLPATKYHFQVRSKAVLGEMSRSKDFSFTTKSELPEILKFLQKKTDNEKTATVYWQTSVPTDSVVRYTPYIKGVLTPRLSKIEGKPDMVADHEITITGLDPGTVYQMEISGRDPFGNQVSKTLPDFTTAIDKEPPVISQVRIESAMITGKTAKIQTIVSWRTDEPSTGQVFFSEGSAAAAEKMKSTALDSSFTTIHTAVITEFNPASIYRIKIESTDESGNLATSRDFTILTPAQSQSIIDVIVKTFENTFGWVKNIKF